MLWEKTRCGWWRWPYRSRAVLFWNKHPCCSSRRQSQHRTVQTGIQPKVGMDYREGWKPHKIPEALWPISRKVWKNRLCMITNLHRKPESYLQVREHLSIKTYPYKAQSHVHSQLNRISWINAGARTGDLFYSLFSLFFLSFSHLFIQNPLPCAYIEGQGFNIPISMPGA